VLFMLSLLFLLGRRHLLQLLLMLVLLLLVLLVLRQRLLLAVVLLLVLLLQELLLLLLVLLLLLAPLLPLRYQLLGEVLLVVHELLRMLVLLLLLLKLLPLVVSECRLLLDLRIDGRHSASGGTDTTAAHSCTTGPVTSEAWCVRSTIELMRPPALCMHVRLRLGMHVLLLVLLLQVLVLLHVPGSVTLRLLVEHVPLPVLVLGLLGI
jgi:hypothetical protein